MSEHKAAAGGGEQGRAWRMEAMGSSLAGKAAVVAMYLGLNVTLNMLNKWVLSHYGFAFPLLLSLSHAAFSCLLLSPLMCARPFRQLHADTLKRQGLGLVCVGIFFAVNVGFNNLSLTSISLSLNQVIRASIPIVTAVASFYVEETKPSRDEMASLCVLFLGVAVAVYEGSDTRSSFVGILLCIGGTVCNGLMMSFSGRLMSEKVDVLRLAWYTAPVSFAALLPFYSALEAPRFGAYTRGAGSGYVGYVLLTCCVALAYNLIHYLMIQFTSAVTTTVIGEMKIITILLLSAVLLGESKIWSVRMMVGCVTAILGFCMYSHIKLAPSSQASAPLIKGVPALPLLSTFGDRGAGDRGDRGGDRGDRGGDNRGVGDEVKARLLLSNGKSQQLDTSAA